MTDLFYKNFAINRILVIRGGAIGDFILTLPAIRLLREAFPEAELEVLGHHSIIQLVSGRTYAAKTRSIDTAPLAGFFSSRVLDPTWCAYFASFQQVVSYVYDPDHKFSKNLLRAGVRHLISGSPRISSGLHASYQLARPLENLGLFLKDPAAYLHPSEEEKRASHNLLDTKRTRSPYLVIHPGSGGKHKNWPISYWEVFCDWILQNFSTHDLICIGGEADKPEIEYLKVRSPHTAFFENLPLPVLTALLSKAHVFVGHDTGISHIAAAAGAPCLLLYGPTDPEIWAPKNYQVRVLTSPTHWMKDLPFETVCQAFGSLMQVLYSQSPIK